MSALLSDTRREPTPAVLVGTPTLGMVSIYWHNQMAELFRCGKPMNRALVERSVKGGAVDAGRNALVAWALALEDPHITHVFFVDDDVILPPNALIRLLGHQLPIVSGLYYAKTPDPQPLILMAPATGTLNEVPHDALVRCYAHGMGCTLIARQVFELLEPPWFLTTQAEPDATGRMLQQTEDVYFCERATRAGYTATVDTGLLALHYDKVRDRGYPVDAWDRFIKGEPVTPEVAA